MHHFRVICLVIANIIQIWCNCCMVLRNLTLLSSKSYADLAQSYADFVKSYADLAQSYADFVKFYAALAKFYAALAKFYADFPAVSSPRHNFVFAESHACLRRVTCMSSPRHLHELAIFCNFVTLKSSEFSIKLLESCVKFHEGALKFNKGATKSDEVSLSLSKMAFI